MYKRVETALCLFFLTFFVSCMLITCLSGCSAERKAQREEKKDAKAIQRLLSRDVLDDACAENYPNKDSITTKDSIWFDTLYIPIDVPGKDSIIRDSIPCIAGKCPPMQRMIVTKYTTRTITIRTEITAKVNACEDDKRKLTNLLTGVTAERDKFKARAKKLLIWLLILAGASGMYIFLKFKKIIK